MESISADLRRGIPWVLVPLSIAIVTRAALEPSYVTVKYFGLVALLAVFALAHTWLARKTSPLRIRAALVVNFLAINLGYFWIGQAMNAYYGWRADSWVHAIDCALFRGDPQRFLAAISRPWLSTVTMLGYLGFAGFLFYLFLGEAFVLTRATGQVQLGLMRLYGVGFSGYILLPASGPAFHHPSELPAIQHSAFSAALQPWVLSNCSQVDVCPSIHAAVCAFTLSVAFVRRRWLFWLLLPVGLALLLGTVYFQYHYFLDLPFGLALGAVAAWSVFHVHSRSSFHGSARAAG